MTSKLNVLGTAIVEGVSKNRIKYTAKELDKFAGTLKGVPILKDHNATCESTIGIVEASESIDKGKKVDFKGWIKDDSVNEKIVDGRIKSVSIGATCGKLVKESEDSDVMEAKDIVAMELSLTPTPGVDGATIRPLKNFGESVVENTHEIFDASVLDNYSIIEQALIKEAVMMVETKVKEQENPEPENGEEIMVCPKCGWKTREMNIAKCQECGTPLIKRESEKPEVPAEEPEKKKDEESCVSKPANESVQVINDKKMKEEAKMAEVEEKAKLLEAAEAKLKAVEEKLSVIEAQKRKELEEAYKKLAEEKKATVMDVSKLSEDAVLALMETLKGIKTETVFKGEVGTAPKETVTKEKWDGYVLERGFNGKFEISNPTYSGTKRLVR